jgi:tRNA G10  N-methylase Trm11
VGNYSYGCSINPIIFSDFIANDTTRSSIKGMTDVIKKLKASQRTKKFYDIIITDPPYGFNTEENTFAFAKLYHAMFTLMIKCLKPNGQLLLCLPEISNTGRQIHYFTQKEIVIHQVLIAASENKRKLVLPLNILPKPTWLFKAPYYWESEKALRRAILHFVVS